MKKKIKKRVLIPIIAGGSLLLIAGLVLATFGGIYLGVHINRKTRTNNDPEYVAPPENNTLVFTHNRSLYDKNGNLLRLKGVNAGNLLVTEGWLSPYSCGAKLDENNNPITDKDGNVEYPELDQETTLKAFASNPNLTDEQRDSLWEIYRENWFSDDDFSRIKNDFGMNAIRLPFYWRNILNENEDGTYSRKSETEAFSYLDHFVEQCGRNNIYCILDLHGAPKSQNGYEHSGNNTHDMLWDNEKAIEATCDLWSYIASHYLNSPLSEYIATYDILNEPCGDYQGSTQNNCYPVFDKIYRAIRDTGDKHVITIEYCWTYDKIIPPSKYGWENVQYQIHMYNWTDAHRSDETYFDQMELTMLGHDYNVPYFIGEFTCFGDDYDVWNRWLSYFDRVGYSWAIWTYKKVVVGWWNDNWGLYDYKMYLDNKTHEQKPDMRSATYDELKTVFEKSNTTNCELSIAAGHVKTYLGK